MPRLPPALDAHFRNPWRAAGQPPLEAPVRAENEVCGDWIELGLTQRPQGGLSLSYRVSGCSATVAVASLLARSVEGASLSEARAFDLDAHVADAGGLGATQQHALAVVRRAWAHALASAPSA